MCKLALLREALTRGKRQVLDLLLEHPAVPGSALSRAMGELGTPVSATVVRKHRRGVCACHRIP